MEKTPAKPGAGQEIRGRPFQRDVSLEFEIPGAINDPHPAAADLFENFERSDLSRQCLGLKENIALHARHLPNRLIC